MADLRIPGLAPSAPAVGARPGQKAFFDAALGRAAGAAAPRPAQAAAPTSAAAPAPASLPPSTAASPPAAPGPGGRPLRPGSVLDIRV